MRTLIQDEMKVGEHTATWNGRSDEGAAARPGFYFYRLDTPGFRQTRKMVLLQ